MVPQSDSVDYGDGVEVAVAESKSKSTGGRLIVLGDKQSKAQYIRRRCKLVAGKTILKAMKTQVPDKDGNMGKYKKADFKYDVAAGFTMLHHLLNGSWEVSATTGVFAGFGTAGLSPGRRL